MAKRKNQAEDGEVPPVEEAPIVIDTPAQAPPRVLLDMMGQAGNVVIVESDRSHYERNGYEFIKVHEDEIDAPPAEPVE